MDALAFLVVWDRTLTPKPHERWTTNAPLLYLLDSFVDCVVRATVPCCGVATTRKQPYRRTVRLFTAHRAGCCAPSGGGLHTLCLRRWGSFAPSRLQGQRSLVRTEVAWAACLPPAVSSRIAATVGMSTNHSGRRLAEPALSLTRHMARQLPEMSVERCALRSATSARGM